MSDIAWLSIVGLGEDAPDGLSGASLHALRNAEFVIGPERHLGLLPDLDAMKIPWPVPFADGIDQLLALRGRRVVALASGNPFWFGAGSSIARHLAAHEWVALPAPSVFAWVAARMGWPLEQTGCCGLHAASFTRLRPALAQGARLIVLLRDGPAVAGLCAYLTAQGFGPSQLSLFESAGGPRERRTDLLAGDPPQHTFAHPVTAAVQVCGSGDSLPLAAGRPDHWFDSDGQMTKRPMRALTLSALAPVPFAHLWDIGGGSGSIAIEWLLSHPTVRATTIEQHADRVKQINDNAHQLGVDRLRVVHGTAPQALDGLDAPDVVFVGGGLTQGLLDQLTGQLAQGTRIVANAVTLESESLLAQAQHRLGGDLLRIELAQSAPLGGKRGWKASYPLVQWSITL
jgi:precorrin-6Y C5,15-methyltransferase (decarboxylating)